MRQLRRYQTSYPFNEVRWCLTTRQACPLKFAETLWNRVVRLWRAVNYHRQQEGLFGCHPVRSVNRKLPFQAEVPLDARMRACGNDRDEQSARLDLVAD